MVSGGKRQEEKTHLDVVGGGQFEPGVLVVGAYRLELNSEAQILVLGTMRHLDRESDPRVGMPRRRNQQGHLGIAAEPKCAAAEERPVIAESNRRVPSLDTSRLRHDAGIKIS